MGNSEALYKKGLYLEYFTLAYNVLEAAVAIAFGSMAGSIALIGFGLDSLVESLSSLILIWRLRQHNRISRAAERQLETRAIRLVAITFFILGLYVLVQSILKITLHQPSETSLPGIIIAAVSLIVMPLLWWQKYRTGKRIGSRALIADAKETLACAFLSLALLLGLGMNYLFGFWQADPIVGIIVAIFLFREGREVWQESNEEETDDA